MRRQRSNSTSGAPNGKSRLITRAEKIGNFTTSVHFATSLIGKKCKKINLIELTLNFAYLPKNSMVHFTACRLSAQSMKCCSNVAVVLWSQ
jgi:hypothetical protein